MPTLASSSPPYRPTSWAEFEDIVCEAAKNRWNNQDFTRHGRLGQKQFGVDVYGTDDKGQNVALQCKHTVRSLTEKIIDDEVAEVDAYPFLLTTLYIATTADADAPLQAYARRLSEQRKKSGIFGVQLLFWNDIWQDLSRRDESVFQHFPAMRPPAPTLLPSPTHDINLFEKFQSALEYEPTIRFLKDYDFNNQYCGELLDPLFEFVQVWNQPAKEFLDLGLQEELATLRASAVALVSLFATNTVANGRNSEMRSVRSDFERGRGIWSSQAKTSARELNGAATSFVQLYDQFVRNSKNKLLR